MDPILYTAAGSNCSQRVEWVLRYKGISYEKILIDPATDSPTGYVPYLSLDGAMVAESMAIAEYLEELFPDQPLFPDAALEKARVREVCEFVNSTIHPAQNGTILRFLRPELAPEGKQQLRAQWIAESLRKLQPRLFRNSAYAVGEHFSLADIFVAVIYTKGQVLGAPSDREFARHLSCLTAIAGHEVLR